MNYIFKYKIPKEYINLINDIIKFSTIFFIINFLLFVSMSNKDLFNKNFCDIFFFLNIGIIFYHLVITKIIIFIPYSK
jgi:hypothetical protein